MSIEEWCTYLAELTGLEARFEPTEHTIDSVQLDLTRMHELAGPTAVDWKDGMRADGGGPPRRAAVGLSASAISGPRSQRPTFVESARRSRRARVGVLGVGVRAERAEPAPDDEQSPDRTSTGRSPNRS